MQTSVRSKSVRAAAAPSPAPSAPTGRPVNSRPRAIAALAGYTLRMFRDQPFSQRQARLTESRPNLGRKDAAGLLLITGLADVLKKGGSRG
jgi:hypothetical protein